MALNEDPLLLGVILKSDVGIATLVDVDDHAPLPLPQVDSHIGIREELLIHDHLIILLQGSFGRQGLLCRWCFQLPRCGRFLTFIVAMPIRSRLLPSIALPRLLILFFLGSLLLLFHAIASLLFILLLLFAFLAFCRLLLLVLAYLLICPLFAVHRVLLVLFPLPYCRLPALLTGLIWGDLFRQLRLRTSLGLEVLEGEPLRGRSRLRNGNINRLPLQLFGAAAAGRHISGLRIHVALRPAVLFFLHISTIIISGAGAAASRQPQ
mmetsp:Transcript_17555/g.37283  ORF Transcript_17555/g.37283 Transcript_17555/m.37283 type:complete len:265 (+) Transcript_17555:454-1248(+)